MTSKWKILAPIDLTRSTEGDVHYAVCVAAAFRAELHLLYVVEGGSPRRNAHDWPAGAFDGEYSGIDVHRAVVHGPTAETIVEYADSLDANLIVMASRRYGRWNRFWRRSVTEAVMNLSRRPVFIYSKSAVDGDFHFRNSRLLCVEGLESHGETALVAFAKMIAARSNSDISLLHVVPEASEALLHDAVDGGTRPLSRERAAMDLADLAHRLRLRATTSVMVGEPEKCIASAASEHSVDVVMVSRASGRLKATYGFHLEGILGRLRCPLLTIPIGAPITVHASDGNRAGLRHRDVVSAAGLAIDEHLDHARDFDESPAEVVLTRR